MNYIKKILIISMKKMKIKIKTTKHLLEYLMLKKPAHSPFWGAAEQVELNYEPEGTRGITAQFFVNVHRS